MKHFLLFILFAGFLTIPATVNSALVKPASENSLQVQATNPPSIKKLKVADLEKALGRKLTLKEKISFFILKKTKSAENADPGQTAFLISILGAGLLILGFFVPYVILGALVGSIVAIVLGNSVKREYPDSKKARSAVLLGWITLGITAFIFLLASIVIASWGVF